MLIICYGQFSALPGKSAKHVPSHIVDYGAIERSGKLKVVQQVLRASVFLLGTVLKFELARFYECGKNKIIAFCFSLKRGRSCRVNDRAYSDSPVFNCNVQMLDIVADFVRSEVADLGHLLLIANDIVLLLCAELFVPSIGWTNSGKRKNSAHR